MFQYVVIEQCGSKILRIATYDFILCLRCIRQEYEIMYYIQQAFLPEQAVHHGEHRIKSAIKYGVCSLCLMPAIEKFVWSKERTNFIVHAIADDYKGIITE